MADTNSNNNGNNGLNKIFSKELISDIEEELKDLDYGSLELYVQKGIVTQITKRRIRKTEYLTKQGK